MFRSLTSFIFGTSSLEIDKKDQPVEQQEQQQQQHHHHQQQQQQSPLKNSKEKSRQPFDELLVDAEDTFIITPCTSSVTGKRETTAVVSKNCSSRRGKNKGSKSNKRKVHENTLPTLSPTQQLQPQQQSQPQPQPKQQQPDQKTREPSPEAINILTSSHDLDEDIEEEDWCIVEREDERNDLPFIDLEEKPSEPEVKAVSSADEETASLTAVSFDESTSPKVGGAAAAAQRRRLQLIGTHSLYSGPRPQQQRNYLQRVRSGRFLSLSASSSVETATTGTVSGNGSDGGCVEGSRSISLTSPADCFDDERVENAAGVTQSLYTISPASISANGHGQGNGSIAMEESWFVTPPPCFTSIGPIHMETSPYEDLLIEHPSMSVYFSIRSAQEDSFVNLDVGLKDNQKQTEVQGKKKKRRPLREKSLPQEQQQNSALAADEKKSAVMTRRATAARIDRYSATQLKQELLERSNQKSFEKKERSHMLCRRAIKRANKTRDYQSKANCQRRADLQHFRVVSGVNNNRKCCF